MSTENKNPIKGVYVKVSKDFLDNLPVISPTTASIILMAVATLNQRKGTENHVVTNIFLEDMLEALNMPSSASDVRDPNFYTWFNREFDIASKVKVNGILIIEEYALEDKSAIVDGKKVKRKVVEIIFSKDAMQFFQKISGQFFQILVDGVYRLSHKYSWELYKEFILRQNYSGGVTELEFFTSYYKGMLDIDKDAYVRRDGHFDRTNFDKRCVREPLNDIAGGGQILLRRKDNNGKADYFYKDKVPGSDGRLHIKYYISYEVKNFI